MNLTVDSAVTGSYVVEFDALEPGQGMMHYSVSYEWSTSNSQWGVLNALTTPTS